MVTVLFETGRERKSPQVVRQGRTKSSNNGQGPACQDIDTSIWEAVELAGSGHFVLFEEFIQAGPGETRSPAGLPYVASGYRHEVF